jgi:hypothetical protein
MIRQDFAAAPPMPFLSQILDSKAKIYVFMWERKDDDNQFTMSWRALHHYFNKNTFRTNLRRLTDVGLISYDEDDEGVSVNLVGWDEIDD